MGQFVTKECNGKIYKIIGEYEVGRWLESNLDIDEYVTREIKNKNKCVEIKVNG
jgi:hypothetical protein